MALVFTKVKDSIKVSYKDKQINSF